MGMTHEEKAEEKGLLDFLVELIQTGENGPGAVHVRSVRPAGAA